MPPAFCILLLILASLASCHALGAAASTGPEARAEVEFVLDDWHAAAAVADGERYFGHMAPDSVFVGTDATERWSRSEFQAYAEPHFSEGHGWSYTPHSRHVAFGPHGIVAWVDEQLTNAKYGELRGMAVLRRQGGDWRIVHYTMSFAIPNERTSSVIELIRAPQ